MTDFDEKRQHPRFDIVWPVEIHLKDEIIEGETVNISMEGISLHSDDPLPLNEVFRILIRPHDQQVVEISGKVVWSDVYGIGQGDETYGMGICFVEVSDQNLAVYKELISIFDEK